MADGIVIKTYREQEISVNQRGWFSTLLPGSKQNSTNETLEGLEKAIDAYYTRLKKTRKLDLPVVLGNRHEEVVLGTVTGVSLHTYYVTGLKDENHDFYPDLEWIREELGRRWNLMQDVREIEAKLKPFLISHNRRPSWNNKASHDYGEMIDDLEAEYVRKRDEALELDNAR